MKKKIIFLSAVLSLLFLCVLALGDTILFQYRTGDIEIIVRTIEPNEPDTPDEPNEPNEPNIPPLQTLYEAEDANVVGASIQTNVTEFSGSGFVDFQHPNGDYVEWIVEVDSNSTYEINTRYGLSSGTRTLRMNINGADVNDIPFTGNGSWNVWQEYKINVNLKKGFNTIRLSSIGSNGPNIDYINITKVETSYVVKPISIAKILGEYYYRVYPRHVIVEGKPGVTRVYSEK